MSGPTSVAWRFVPDATILDEQAADDPENPHRLPPTVRPRRYDLTLEPDLDTATFAGEETIEVEVVEPTSEIVLNAAEIEVDEASVELPGDGDGADGGAKPAILTLSLDDEA